MSATKEEWERVALRQDDEIDRLKKRETLAINLMDEVMLNFAMAMSTADPGMAEHEYESSFVKVKIFKEAKK